MDKTFFYILIAVLSACASQQQSRTVIERLATPQDVVGTTWSLYKMGGSRLQAGSKIDLIFDRAQGGITGNAGCNRYQGAFSGSLAAPQFGRLIATKKLCTNPAGVMQQESHFLTYILAVRSVMIRDGVLVLKHPDGDLEFTSESRP